jgi:hypothetical protein
MRQEAGVCRIRVGDFRVRIGGAERGGQLVGQLGIDLEFGPERAAVAGIVVVLIAAGQVAGCRVAIALCTASSIMPKEGGLRRRALA